MKRIEAIVQKEIAGRQVDFNSTTIIISIINDSQLDSVVSAIMDVAIQAKQKMEKSLSQMLRKRTIFLQNKN